MSKINYEENNIISTRDNFDKCNNTILESLNNIYKEITNINEVISTPKSKEIIESYDEYLVDRIDFVNNKKDNYKTLFSYIIDEYNNYDKDVKTMLGDKND